MIYCIEQNYLTKTNLLILALLIVFIIMFFLITKACREKKYEMNFSNVYFICRIFMIVCIVFMLILFILNVGENIYCIDSYKNMRYDTVQGTIENFEYTYPNHSNHADGIKFSINDKQFTVRKGIFNIGYSINDNIITHNGQYLKIYYLPPEGEKYIDTILRIDY